MRAAKLLLGIIPILVIGMVFLFFGKKETRTFSRTTEAFSNPLMGYAPLAWHLDEEDADYTLIYVPVLWSEWESEEGVFDTERLEEENRLPELRKKGIHVVLRFVCDDPGSEAHLDIPQWLYDKTADGTTYDTSYGKGYAPNYANPVFVEAHADAVAALGAHFTDDPLISYIELGSIGHWGEWHVNIDEGLPPLPDAAIREQYITPWIDAFPDAKILMRRPFTPAKEYGFGLYNDVTGDRSETLRWLDWIAKGGEYHQTGETDAIVPMQGFWKNAPVGGELTSGVSMEQLLTTDLKQTTDLIRESHTTLLGPKIAEKEYKEGYDAVLSAMGYRIGVEKISLRRDTVTLSWFNTGTAPMYCDWPVRLYAEDADGTVLDQWDVDLTLSDLLPGQKTVTRTRCDLPRGARLTLGIVDPMTGRDSVRLAVETEYENGRNLLIEP